ncbi:alkaline phosphatase [Pseudoalteromonas sp. CO325X]|uniref:alkaline phosphatase n=1 Tax=Pseudoalteromonas sp. CO325X TaxID=1777262 RepID=UPI0010238758|nr:alkaline phosphatase [Pseudoalteromonas sp. CO325X]RZF83310.1 alkaline phosphatase [Pseudoalteromonas sp. CO325X]
MKRTLTFASMICASFFANAEQATPKNIIYMIGDGMGPAYTSAYRYYVDDKSTKVVEPTVFDSILVGMAHTYPDDDTIVTDSAAGATALSTATKSYNGAIAVDTQKHDLKTMLEIAKERKMTTALVATSQINHATPASFAAHNESRRNYDDIANDFFDNKIKGALPVDLMLGGGTQYFIREDRSLVNEFIAQGYQYSDNLSQLEQLQQIPALGLYAAKGLPFALDGESKRLTKMTDKALSLLAANENPFFVMIEGSQIDWCGHANDIACAMAEMDDFAHAIDKAKAYVDAHPDTLLVITADHSTGGLTIGANGQYLWHADVVKGVTATAGVIAERLLASDDMATVWQQTTALEFTEARKVLLTQAKNVGTDALVMTVKKLINEASFTGWTTSGHTAIDVPVFAYGNGAEQFIGSQNNTDIAQKLINFINNK